MTKKKIIEVNIVKDWDSKQYNTYTPFKNNNNYGSELYSKQSSPNIVKDWKYKKFNTNPFTNSSLYGYEMKNKLSNVSISRPRYWPSRGLYEK
tara:strand:+ start:204 stop:482 length:279 start_codon:yes stop_codon:yes gene_type:complete